MALVDLKEIKKNTNALKQHYSDRLLINQSLTRRLVSFQANKKEPGYRWYKFKEGYSSALVEHFLGSLHVERGKLIDPFAGSGTSLFASAERGLSTLGIELLPIGVEIIEVRKILFSNDTGAYRKKIQWWIERKPWLLEDEVERINHLNITRGAFPQETEILIGRYLSLSGKQKDKNFARVLRFALLCILEEISYTRKDGQYLRWDYRSNRRNGKSTFSKGKIKNFDNAIIEKLSDIHEDLGPPRTLLSLKKRPLGKIEILNGSCLSLLPTLPPASFDVLMTSPPYCNRYDYTRTYALELALLGANEDGVKKLRQTMLSCTVENREKDGLENLLSKELVRRARTAFNQQKELRDIVSFLEDKKKKKELNNPGIARMVKNYFYEMALVIFESARILKQNAPFIMVNDNVKYAGVTIPVDLVLSSIAEQAGYEVEKIWMLPSGKGNSSQQMGKHGREELRKCVYIWKRL